MLVYKCPKCGVTYSKKDVPQNEICAACDTYLKVVNVKEEVGQPRVGRQSSVGRVRTIPVIQKEEKERVSYENGEPVRDTVIEEKNNDTYSYSVNEAPSEDEIEGTIINAVNDSGFRRLPWEKLYDRYFYSQNVSDIQNSIYVRCVDGTGNISNKTIVMYGQIRGGIGIFRTGMKIRGEGKTNNRNEFVAKSLLLEDGVTVTTQTEPADIIYYFSPLILVIICLLVGNLTSLMKAVISSRYIKWYFFSIIGSFFVSYYTIGRVIRLPILNRIHTCTWVSIILGTIIFFVFKAIFGV